MKVNEIKKKNGYTCYFLINRSQLLQKFTPKFPDVIAHHITCKFGVPEDCELPIQPNTIFIVGEQIDENRGVQVLVVEVDGSTVRPDGGTYHITWSLDKNRGAKPVHSNDVLKTLGFNPVDPVPIVVEPKFCY